MPDNAPGPVQFPPFDPERVDAAFAEYARNDALSCKECHGSGMTKVMRYTSACLACKGTGRIPPATDTPAARREEEIAASYYEGLLGVCDEVLARQDATITLSREAFMELRACVAALATRPA